MSEASPQERLRRRAEEARDRCSRSRLERERRRGQPPRPGDLFVFPETAEDSIQWAVVGPHPDDEDRLLLVAADFDPHVGSADVAAPPESACGALSLRCRFGVWLAAEQLDPELRTGFLEPEVLDEVRSKRAEIEAGRPPRGSVLERDTDAEPEYQDLLAELEKARTVLHESRSERKEEVAAVVPFPPPAPASSRWGSFGSPWALAASILMVVGLGFIGGTMWQHGNLADLEHQHALARAELEQRVLEQQRLEEVHHQELAEIEQERNQAEQRYEQRIADLERRVETGGRTEPLVDLPFVWLSSADEIRGESRTLNVPAAASYFVLILEVNDPDPYPRYRLDVFVTSTGDEVYSSELKKTGVTEVSVALPRRWLGSGEYRLRLYGLRDGGEARLVEEYKLRLDLD